MHIYNAAERAAACARFLGWAATGTGDLLDLVDQALTVLRSDPSPDEQRQALRFYDYVQRYCSPAIESATQEGATHEAATETSPESLRAGLLRVPKATLAALCVSEGLMRRGRVPKATLVDDLLQFRAAPFLLLIIRGEIRQSAAPAAASMEQDASIPDDPD